MLERKRSTRSHPQGLLRLATAAALLTTLGLWGCTQADSGALPEEELPPSAAEQSNGPEELGQMWAALTAQDMDAYAQRGLDYIVPDTVTWTRAGGCGACHRVGAPLFGAALSAYTGYEVDTSANGTGYLASFLAAEQTANGSWIHDAAGNHTFIKSSYNVFGLAGYTLYDSDIYKPNLQRAIDWAIGATAGYRFTHPLDGRAMQGVTSNFVPMDHGSDPVTYGSPTAATVPQVGWQMPTAHFAVATRALLDTAPEIPALRRENYNTFLNSLANSLEGQYARSNGTWRPAEVGYAAIGAVQAGRMPANNTTVAAMRDELLNRYINGGWGDTVNGNPNVYSTGVALYALCLMEVRSDQNTTVANALNWLANQQCIAGNNYCGTGNAALNGSWRMVRPNGTVLAGDVPSTFATLAMGCYGSLGVRVTLTPASVQLAPNLAVSQTTSFNVDVRNTGYTRNTYELVPSGNWPGMVISQNNPSMTLSPGAQARNVVTVTVPPQMPQSTIIPISVKVSYLTRSGMVERTVTFNIFIPPQPREPGLRTVTTILSPNSGALISQGTSVTLSASVRLEQAGSAVTLGTLTFYSGGAAIATVQANASGVFTYNWPVPSTAPLGPQTFSATYNGYATSDYSINYLGSTASRTFNVGNTNGSTCQTDAQCHSGFCVDGVCCNTACGDGVSTDCQACSRLAGAASDGTCGVVRAGTICRPSRGFCDVAETCDGTNTACNATDSVVANGTSCGLNQAACSNGDCRTIPRGLNGRYFNNTTLTEPFALNRVDQTINFPWGTGGPGAPVNTDNFSARWTGDVITPTDAVNPARFTGRYWFYTQSDQGVRLWVDGKLIIDNWTSHTTTVDSGSIFLEAGRRYSVMLEYWEGTGDANIILQWQPPGQLSSVIAATSMTPAVTNPLAIRIRSPLDRTSYLAPATVVVDVDVLGLYANISSVELFRDGLSQGVRTTAPYTWTQASLGAGVYTYTARVTGTGTNGQGQSVPLTQNSRMASVRVLPSPAGTSVGQGLTADYFNGTNFNRFEFTRSEYTLFLDGTTNNPLPPDILNPNSFSVRWTGTVIPAYSQAYTFTVQANHPAKVWLKGVLILDTMANPGQTTSAAQGLSAGERASLRVEYFKNSSTDTLMKLLWQSPSEPLSLIPGTRLYPATVSTRP